MRHRSYSELRQLSTFKERYDYLKLNGRVGAETFGYNRYVNQRFYRSTEWKHIRDQIIIRDNGCDLGVEGYDLHLRIYIHHLNPMTVDDIDQGRQMILDPDNLICVSFDTHQAIHFGDESLLPQIPIERIPGDTCPWRY
jgi:hypothetical protein